jgi:low temperature requirement protein LtrA
LRVSTLEIFFDLVFAFTLTQLTSVLATRLTWLAILQVLLIFGLLWWMYGAYTWLTNARPPVHTAERLLLLVGMAGFLVVGLAIPRGFAAYGYVLGLGYLVVVIVHAVLYYRVNENILRVAPFNICSALLVTIAGLLTPSGGHRQPHRISAADPGAGRTAGLAADRPPCRPLRAAPRPLHRAAQRAADRGDR